MKLTEKFSAKELERPSWALYEQCAVLLGHVLDDKFETPHIHVYEHTRHTFDEMFYHPPAKGEDERDSTATTASDNLAREEREVLGVLNALEEHRRLTVIGDVGVGKSTFLRHLIDSHFTTDEFGKSHCIYLDWKAFTAPLSDPLPSIHRRFVQDVYSVLEKRLTAEQLHELDDSIVLTAPMFSPARSWISRLDKKKRDAAILDQIRDALARSAVDLAFERMNAICRDNPNALVLIIDNIDQLPPPVLGQLFQFLVEVQFRTIPLVIVAMRDHTFDRGFSAYRPEGVTLSWEMRLRAPDVRRMLARRVEYFHRVVRREGQRRDGQAVRIPIGSMTISQDLEELCKKLLEAPCVDAEAYEFLLNWCNYNIRELFHILQAVLSNGGFSAFDKSILFSTSAPPPFGVDECLIALTLGNHLMYFSNKSQVLNPYTAGADTHPGDQVVTVRIMQYLKNRRAPAKYAVVREKFCEWGYAEPTVDERLHAMVDKDVLWADCGPPSALSDDASVRLSYRGLLYVRKLLGRALFNYMMSFDMRAPNDAHPVFRHHKSEFHEELSRCAGFDKKIDSEALSARVLGVADVVFEAEQREVEMLGTRRVYKEFKGEVAPVPICVDVVDGLARLFNKSFEERERQRFTTPSTGTLQDVAAAQERYRNFFSAITDVGVG